MFKLRLVVGGVLFCALAMAVAAASAGPTGEDRKNAPSARAEYTVASASGAAQVVPVDPSRVRGSVRRPGLGGLSDTLTLVVVGSMLIGLAAAVRRTT